MHACIAEKSEIYKVWPANKIHHGAKHGNNGHMFLAASLTLFVMFCLMCIFAVRLQHAEAIESLGFDIEVINPECHEA